MCGSGGRVLIECAQGPCVCDLQHCVTHLSPQHWKVEPGRKFQIIHLRLPETRDRGEREETACQACTSHVW